MYRRESGLNLTVRFESVKDSSIRDERKFGLDDIKDLINLYVSMLKEHYDSKLGEVIRI
ncbi:MAG: hypothetical protein QW374_03035 [Candidatus Bathyarchaeia archaeon]|nr:hypothetical protein [Candidatus Bathyarchaeota archaeon]